MTVYAIHEADGQDVTMQKEVAYSLATGGGKPGQGYPCVMVADDIPRVAIIDEKSNRHDSRPSNTENS